ncbi:hypothetical protein OG912_32140 [Streptomyces sp. NBC_00464]|uniref:hypothetical protein n=1 Tax=Streptomyces sp. NBC_00464 TaxID=2975751 RepID=UPI002E183285
MAFRGIDLLDVYRGRLSLRRLRVLIQHLPPESATKTALRNASPEPDPSAPAPEFRPDKAAWSSEMMLLADIKDQLVLARSVAIAAAGGTPPDFTPTPRPGVAPASASPKRMTDEMRRALDPRLRNQPKEA